MVEKEDRVGYGLGEEDMGLQLAWMGTSNWVAWSWEEIGVDELSDFEGQTKQRGKINGKSMFGWCEG
jgi:hypothetical protein